MVVDGALGGSSGDTGSGAKSYALPLAYDADADEDFDVDEDCQRSVTAKAGGDTSADVTDAASASEAAIAINAADTTEKMEAAVASAAPEAEPEQQPSLNTIAATRAAAKAAADCCPAAIAAEILYAAKAFVELEEKVEVARKAEGGKARACGHFFANIDSTLHIVNDREVCPFLTAHPLATTRSVLCSRSLSAANHRLTPATLAIHRRRSSS